MAGDIGVRERAVILPTDQAMSLGATMSAVASSAHRTMHMYGSRVMVMEESLDLAAPSMAQGMRVSPAVVESLTLSERLGYSAFKLRESSVYVHAKEHRPRDGQAWNFESETTHPGGCTLPAPSHAAAALAPAGAPTSQRMTGSIAVGIIIVEGPNTNLKFSAEEQTKVIAEVQNGLGWLATQNPEGLVFKYDIQVITVNVQPGADTLSAEEKEALWRDPAMQQLGFGTGLGGVSSYVESLRTNLGTNWTFCAFFTKYPLYHFAYASIGGPRLVMQYDNDGWGPDNIDRVFAHETGHIFGAPDEYAASGCTCGGSWGFYGKPNENCANCAPAGGVECIMKGNTWNMCSVTPYHFGFPLTSQTYTGVWRQGNDAHYLWVNSSWTSFISKWQELSTQNLRLHNLKITREQGAERFHGVFREGQGGHYLWVNADQANFISKWQELAPQGLRLVDLEVQNVNGNLLYSGVWLPGNDGYYLWINADWNDFLAKWQELSQQNLRLTDLRIVTIGGQQKFFGVWREGNGGHYLWVNADWNNFITKWQELGDQGLRLVDIEAAETPQGRRFSGVWLAGTDGYYLWSGADWQNFYAKWLELSDQGLRLVDLDVIPGSGAQSPTPTNRSAAKLHGGMANSPGSSSPMDGWGGSGAALPTGALGFGVGSLTGSTAAKAKSGLVGEGGGNLSGLALAGTPTRTSLSNTTSRVGSGGGTTPSTNPNQAPVVQAGFGGGSVT